MAPTHGPIIHITSAGIQSAQVTSNGNLSIQVNPTVVKTTTPGMGKLVDHQQRFFAQKAGVTDVSVYREFYPSRDQTEWFIIFTKDNSRHRATLVEDSEVMERMHGESLEWYIVGRAIQLILDSQYEPW